MGSVIAVGLTVALYLFWLALGYGVLGLLHTRRNLLQTALLAPAVGVAATIVPIFWLNRAGLPVARFGGLLAAGLLLAAVVLLWWTRPRVPVRRYAPFGATFVLALVLTGRPMLEFGLDWLSYANDDMANYVLGARHLLDHGFFDTPEVDALTSGVDYGLYYWLLYVPGAVRAGSELLLAWVISVTGLTGHQVYMPATLALQLVLISSAGALVCQSRRHRLAALLTCGLLGLSALTALGTLYQLIAQVAGLGLLAASATVLMRPFEPLHPRRLVERGVLLGILGSALLIVYPEVTPFLGAAMALYVAVGLVRRRSALSPRPLALVLGTAAVAALVVLNRYALEAGDFLLEQTLHGTRGVEPESTRFPYFLIPSGLANLWGLQPVSSLPPEPWLTASIGVGGLLSVAVVGASVILTWRRQPVATIALVMFGLALQLFLRRADFGLFKLAMFLQPFMLGTLVVWWLGRVRRPVYRVGPLVLLGLLGLYGQVTYVQASRGFGSTFIEVRQISSTAVNAEFRQLLAMSPTSHLLLDTANIVLAKLQAAYTDGVPTYFPSRFYFAIGPDPYRFADQNVRDAANRIRTAISQRQLTATFPWFGEGQSVDVPPERSLPVRDSSGDEPSSGPDPGAFSVNTIGQAATGRTDCGWLIGTTGRQSVFNRRRIGGEEDSTFFARPCGEVTNHLIFVDTPLGQQYYQGQAGWVSFYQVEDDPIIPGGTMVGVGRRILTEIMNPRGGVRAALSLTVSAKGDGENSLPPAVIIGADRQPLPLVGRGSARVFSPPLTPIDLAGRELIGLDMGVDGSPFADPRGGLMASFGTDVARDRRRLVGFARDVSLISEDEYARLAPPSFVDEFPAALTHPDLEYSGVYEDGWVSEQAFFGLTQPAGPSSLVVRGVTPLVGESSFSSELLVSVDGQPVGSQNLGPGTFEARLTAPPGAGRRRVELRFSNVQRLPGQDQRPVAGRLMFVGFQQIAGADTQAQAQAPADVITVGSGLGLGAGWYALESISGETYYRWAESGAALVVVDPTNEHRAVFWEIEPGPGVGLEPFTLRIRDQDGHEVGTVDVRERQRVDLALPPPTGTPGPRVFRLHADRAGRATPGDPRSLDFRVFRLGWADSPDEEAWALTKVNEDGDIGPARHRHAIRRGDVPTDGLFVGEGWSRLESFEGLTFRWVDDGAEIVVTAPSGTRSALRLEVAPGASVGLKPFVLQVRDEGGRVVATTPVRRRETVTVTLPIAAGERATFTLHAQGGGMPAPNDARILNFRVFSFDWDQP